MPVSWAPDWDQLHAACMRWLGEAREHVLSELPTVPPDGLLRARVALYVLLAGSEFTETAFDACKLERYHAARACARTTWEFAVTIRWCFLAGDETDQRLRAWARNTVKQRRKLLAGQKKRCEGTPASRLLAEYSKLLAECDRILTGLDESDRLEQVEQHPWPSLAERYRAVELHDAPREAKGFLEFNVYQPLFESTHASLEPERFFSQEEDADVIQAVPHMPPDTPYMVVMGVLWLATAAYLLLGWSTDDLLVDFKAVATLLWPPEN